jgi:hypothetical protein
VENSGFRSTGILKVGRGSCFKEAVVKRGGKEGNLEGRLAPGFVVLTSSLVRGDGEEEEGN